MKSKIIGILLCLSSLQMQARAGTEGHGGDPLRLLFEDARAFAANRVLKAVPCAFGSDVSSQVRDWILNQKQALADDILQSSHIWITDKQSTCAFTQAISQAPITFSFEACRPGVLDISNALKILVHESVHHFGVTDEAFADKIAEAVYNLGSQAACSIPPAQDPFDPASCPGKHLSSNDLLKLIPLPESNSKRLGRYDTTSRMRTCYGGDWCSSWGKSDKYGFATIVDFGSDYERPLPYGENGLVYARFIKDKPALYVDGADYFQTVSFKALGYIENFNLVLNHQSQIFDPRVGHTLVSDKSAAGWVTNTCFRYSIKGEISKKDNLGNSVRLEYETVLHSTFGNF